MSEDNKLLDRILDKVDEIQKDVYQVRIDMTQHKATFEEHLHQDKAMADSLEKVEEHMTNVDSHLSEYNRQLEIHIAGVKALDEANILNREKFEAYKKETRAKIKQLEKPQVVVKGILWLAGAIITLGAAVGAFKLLFP